MPQNDGIYPSSIETGDLLNQIDDTTAQFAALYAHKSLGQREPI
jgi:hypothetical protein